MKIEAKAFREALRAMRGVVWARPAIPVLGMVRLEASPGALEVRGTDLDHEVVLRLEAEGDDAWTALAAPSLLGMVASGAGVVSIEVAEASGIVRTERRELRIECDDLRAVIAETCGPDDWPGRAASPGADAATVEIPEADLFEALRSLLPFVSTEEVRYYLCGVHLSAAPESRVLQAAATDGHTLGVFDLPNVSWPAGAAIILPRRAAASLLGRLRRGGNRLVRLALDSETKRAGFDLGHGERIETKLVDGTFPNWRRLLPVFEGKVMRFSVSAGALRRFPAPALSEGLVIDPSKGFMRMRDTPRGLVMELPITGADERDQTGTVCVNPSYLRRFASVAPDGVATITGEAAHEPLAVITAEPRFYGVVMPMRGAA